jgi:hypothetical protein
MLPVRGGANITNRRWVLALSLLTLALGSCAQIPKDVNIATGTADRWLVGVSGPRSGGIDGCLEDPIIEEAIESANLPSTHLGIKLRESAKEEDARRIADCLKRGLKSGDVSIVSPRN